MRHGSTSRPTILCNPHQMVRDERKAEVRERFFRQFLSQTRVHMVNNHRHPAETQAAMRPD